jgi:argininosuccinate lyase
MTKKPWGGRFTKETKREVEQFTASISFDKRLAPYDIAGSIAHARTLNRAGVLTDRETQSLEEELCRIGAEIEAGTFAFRDDLEDVHMNIEAALTERLGELGGKLHTGRSRNDQVSADTRAFVMDWAGRAAAQLKGLRKVIIGRAREQLGVVMPGYTHLQRAQPVLLSHYLLAYWEMFRRDGDRFAAAQKSADVSPLGSGALAGVPYGLDRKYTADLAGFSAETRNSMDAVSDRDFVIDFLFGAAVTMMHLSRLCEELVIFSSSEFGYVTLPDGYATGSSIMPQKKNPDVAELIRGKTGRVYGDLFSVLVVMKGLPLTYNRDMQEDKQPLFDAADTVVASTSVMSGMLGELSFNAGRMRNALSQGFITATDAADYLVKKGMSFRDAHEAVGKMVVKLESEGKGFADISASDLKKFSPLFGPDILDALRPEASAGSRLVTGGTAPERVREMIEQIRRIEDQEDQRETERSRKGKTT